MKIMPNRLDRGYFQYKREILDKINEVLDSGWYILGNEVSSFENEFANYTGAKYCVGLASGLDALWISFRLLNIGTGDEVIVPGNTYIASIMGITMNGATPVFIEPNEFYNIDTQKIEEKITHKTKAILAVHLYGQASDMGKIMEIAHKYSLKVVEDCAQSHGACWKGKMTGTYGDVGCFSFYPSKNLGAYGDGGAIITDDEELAQRFKIFRNYGSEKRYYNKIIGANSRLDEIQAGILRIKLQHLNELNHERSILCDYYLKNIKNANIILPQICKGASSIWHQFVIRVHNRTELINYLNSKDIGTLIHYPIPPHLSEAYEYLGLKRGSLPITERYADEVLSLPLYNGMTKEEQDYIIEHLNRYGEQK